MYIYIELGYKLRIQVEKEFEIEGTRDDRSTVVDGQRIKLFAIVDRSSKILERNSTIMASMI